VTNRLQNMVECLITGRQFQIFKGMRMFLLFDETIIDMFTILYTLIK